MSKLSSFFSTTPGIIILILVAFGIIGYFSGWFNKTMANGGKIVSKQYYPLKEMHCDYQTPVIVNGVPYAFYSVGQAHDFPANQSSTGYFAIYSGKNNPFMYFSISKQDYDNYTNRGCSPSPPANNTPCTKEIIDVYTQMIVNANAVLEQGGLSQNTINDIQNGISGIQSWLSGCKNPITNPKSKTFASGGRMANTIPQHKSMDWHTASNYNGNKALTFIGYNPSIFSIGENVNVEFRFSPTSPIVQTITAKIIDIPSPNKSFVVINSPFENKYEMAYGRVYN